MDIAATPILTTINRGMKEVDVVVAVTKLGNTLILDRETGESLFDIKKIRENPKEFDLSLAKRNFSPEPVCRNKMTLNELSDLPYVDKEKLKNSYLKSETGYPVPPKIGIKNIQMNIQ